MITIVVVSYNHAKYIRENLDSIKAQTYLNIELIVADDASKDNSVEVFENWLSENNYPAKKNYHTQNTGLATTLNECVEMVTGKYVKVIAADDFLHPESIQKCVEKLEELGEEYGMVFTDTYGANDSSKNVADIADYNALGNVPPETFKQNLLRGNQIAALTVVMRTEVLKETGKYDPEILAEDYHRWLLISQKYKIAYIPQKLAYYRLHETNISKTRADKIREEVIKLQLTFDKSGIAKTNINRYFSEVYLSNQKVSSALISLYKQYPWKVKRLAFSISNRVPVSLYRFVNKF